ncbi:DUF4230 domain-containing protein [Faecalibacterium prausnitzii]|mgnify:FL=1|uniref:DUF4230 domain-containing protein n=1 Tax=Faecalibacterium prausnitzii TaxID=853 RepID=UPI0026671137|nr:DUF4230 domain-containing protein [Faecalibacterium prausnitzii]
MDEATKPKLSGAKILLAAILVIALLVGGIIYQQSTQANTDPQIDITITLEKIVKTSDLSTSVFKYDGIVEIPNPKKPTNIDYYIYYSASVYAGIDFSQVQFKEDKEKKTITAILPEVQINDTVVEPESLDFMFMNKKADNVSVTTTALTACETDIQRECTSESALLEVARLNTENVIRALAEPVIEQVCEGYTLVIE